MANPIRSFKGHTPRQGKGVFIDPTALVLGKVTLGDDASVWPMAVVRGDMHSITIGDRTSIQDGCICHITHASDYNPGGFALAIGDDVTVGHQAMLHGCTIGNRVLVGMQAMVMDGAVVEDEVIIAAGTLVPPGKTLESGYMYKGSPAKQVRAITEKERSFFTYVAANYVKLKDEHLAELD